LSEDWGLAGPLGSLCLRHCTSRFDRTTSIFSFTGFSVCKIIYHTRKSKFLARLILIDSISQIVVSLVGHLTAQVTLIWFTLEKDISHAATVTGCTVHLRIMRIFHYFKI